MDFGIFLEKMFEHGLEFFQVYYGVYRGTVVDNADPEDRGRIKIVAPGAGVAQVPDVWVPAASFLGAGTNRGWYWPPEIGDAVWVRFSQGRSRYPLCYLPGFFGAQNNRTEAPSELGSDSDHIPRKRGFVTRRGHRLILNEKEGEDAIELTWHKPTSDTDSSQTPARDGSTASLKFNPQGGITLTDKNSNMVMLDAQNAKVVVKDQSGNSLTMSSSGVVLDCGARNFEVKAVSIKLTSQTVDVGDGAEHPSSLGDNWLQWAATHTHGTGVGPSTPPVQPPLPTLNSTTVKVRT